MGGGDFNAHTSTHTLSVWEKNASKRGTAVWVAGEDGRMTYCKLHRCMRPCLRLWGGGGGGAKAISVGACDLDLLEAP